jgi:DNA polymerase-3 subunit delta'
MSSPYPWFEQQWAELARIAAQGRLSHALLLSGRASCGLEAFARHFAHHLLCEDESAPLRPCGSCRACVLFKANNHPDFKMLAPAEPGKAIVIDQVRELSSFYALKPHYQRGKITMVSPANVMNRAAANALLKVLRSHEASSKRGGVQSSSFDPVSLRKISR